MSTFIHKFLTMTTTVDMINKKNILILLLNFFIMTDNSIQANLRKNGLKKKASERTWREWDAIYDYERAVVEKHKDLIDKYRLLNAEHKTQFYRAVAGYLLL